MRPDESVCQSSTEGRDQPPLAIGMRLPLPNAQSEDEGELCTGNHLPMKRRQAHNAGPLPLSPVPPHVNRLTLTCLPRENIATISHKRQGGDRLALCLCKVLWQSIPKWTPTLQVASLHLGVRTAAFLRRILVKSGNDMPRAYLPNAVWRRVKSGSILGCVLP